MANGKQIKDPKRTKVWKILTDKKKRPTKKQKAVERLICAIQQEIEWDKQDIQTWDEIQQGKIDWSGDVRSKRRTRKHI
jgi:hypothetical protein